MIEKAWSVYRNQVVCVMCVPMLWEGMQMCEKRGHFFISKSVISRVSGATAEKLCLNACLDQVCWIDYPDVLCRSKWEKLHWNPWCSTRIMLEEGMKPLPVGTLWLRCLKFLSILWVWIEGFGSKDGLLTSVTPHTDKNVSDNVARKAFCVFWCIVHAVQGFIMSRDI